MENRCEYCKHFEPFKGGKVGGICKNRHGYAGMDWVCVHFTPNDEICKRYGVEEERPEVVKDMGGNVIAEHYSVTTLNGYQAAAMRTCMGTCHNIPYMLINLQGEVGELSSKIAKAVRKGKLWFESDEDRHNATKMQTTLDEQVEFEAAIKGELGDVLWQLSGLCEVLGFSLQEVAEYNINKLASRKERGVIDGNGDNR